MLCGSCRYFASPLIALAVCPHSAAIRDDNCVCQAENCDLTESQMHAQSFKEKTAVDAFTAVMETVRTEGTSLYICEPRGSVGLHPVT